MKNALLGRKAGDKFNQEGGKIHRLYKPFKGYLALAIGFT